MRNFDIGDPQFEAELEALVGPPGKWCETRDFQIRLLSALGLEPDMVLVDLGCGSLRAGLPLIGYLDAGNYIGIDIDSDCVAAAVQLIHHFDLAAKKPLLLRSGTFGVAELDRARFVDRIWCYQTLIHFPEEAIRRFTDAVAHLLNDDGRAWVSVRIVEQDVPFKEHGKWRNFPVNSATLDFYLGAAEAAGLSCDILGTLGDFGLSRERSGAANSLLDLKHRDASR